MKAARFRFLFPFFVLILSSTAPAQPGRKANSLDPTFGDKGIVRTAFGRQAQGMANVVTVQSDGKLLVAGDAKQLDDSACAVARFLPDGSADTSFGTGGRAGVPGLTKVLAIAAAPDGKIVLTGFKIPDHAPNQNRKFAVARLAANGAPDVGFNKTGWVTVDFSPGSYGHSLAHAVFIEPNGNIVAAGEKNHFVMTRLRGDGTLDPAFGAKGYVETTLGTSSRASTLLRQSDGKILAGGFANIDGGSRTASILVRYNASGTLDTAFGSAGKVTLNDGNGFTSVITQSDGTILAAGTRKNGEKIDLSLARYSPDGAPDVAFGKEGQVSAEIANYRGALAIKTSVDNKIFVAGSARRAPNDNDFTLSAFNLDGSPVATFGENGTATARFGSDAKGEIDGVNAAAFLSSGHMLAAGFSGDFKNRNFALARYNPAGTPDASWGEAGTIKASLGMTSGMDSIHNIALQSDGKIVATGVALQRLGYESVAGELAVARYDTNGNLDSSFGEGGKVLASLSPDYTEATRLEVASDGKIVIFGNTQTVEGVQKVFFMRLNANGTPDAAFGKDGVVYIEPERINDFSLQSDGKIVTVGSTYLLPNNDFLIKRLNADGTPDGSFGSNGQVTTDFSGAADAAYALALQNDGKIVVAGVSVRKNDDVHQAAVARYYASGTLDSAFGNGGRYTSAHGGVTSIALQADGKILLAHRELGLTRLDAKGAFDKKFATRGHVSGMFEKLSVQPDGKIIGWSRFDKTTCLLPDGARDITFGDKGFLKADFDASTHDDSITAMTMTPDGKMIVAGSMSGDFALACYK